ncbi:MAG TPA: PAS domain S-box protein, partial [Solirubrobacteraceae bacterium]
MLPAYAGKAGFARALGAFVALIGALIVLGWALGEIIVPSANAVSPAVRLNSGIAFMLAGSALALMGATRVLLVSRFLGAAVTTIGVLTLSEYVFGTDLGIDHLVFDDRSVSVGRMAPNTAAAFVCCGAALLLARSGSERWQPSEVLGLFGALIGWLGVIGFAVDLPDLLQVGSFLKIALPVAICFVCLGAGVAVAVNGRLAGLVTSQGPGGHLVRRLLLALIAVPPLTAVALRAAHSAGIVDEGGVVLLLVGSLEVTLLAIAFSFAHSLNGVERERLQAERDLRSSERRFRGMLESAPDAIVIVDESGEIVLVNDQTERLLGYCAEELVGRPVEMLMPERLRGAHQDHRRLFFRDPAARPMGAGLELYALRNDGSELAVEISLGPLETEQGRLVSAAVRDISQRKRIEDANRRLAAIVEQTEDAVLVETSQGTISEWNRGAQRLYGYTAEEAIGRSVTMLVAPEHAGEEEELTRRVFGGDAMEQHETVRVRKDGSRVHVSLTISPIRDAAGRIVAASAIARDVSERTRFEGQLQYLADHDPLTGLFNRRRFHEELHRELSRARRYRTAGAVLALDLDHFKYINDSLGHSAGDELITRTSEILKHRLRGTDVLGRLGGDEFAIILPGVDEVEAQRVACSLLEAIRETISISVQGAARHTTASIGIAPFTHVAELTEEDLLVEADIAMYDAKEAGRDRAIVYSSSGDGQPRMQARLTWADRIQLALQEERFVLYAQPILALNGDSVPRHELLLRMVGDDGEMVPPGAFLSVAERMGLVAEIDHWVLRQTIGVLADHQHAGHDVCLEVNLSAKSINESDFAAIIAHELQAAGADGRGLCVEITETAAIVNVEHARRFAAKLAKLGCEFAL